MRSRPRRGRVAFSNQNSPFASPQKSDHETSNALGRLRRWSARQFGSFGLPMVLLLGLGTLAAAQQKQSVKGVIRDASTGKPTAARVYLQSDQGEFLLVDSLAPDKSVFAYRVERGESREVHTAVPETGFAVELIPGSYRLTVKKGKEYVPLDREFVVSDQPLELSLELSRWINMSELGWFSGDTHIHLPWQQVPLPLQAEDLNVGIPITYWVTDSDDTPAANNKAAGPVPPARLIQVAKNRVIWPINTEYEIFSVSGARHTLGAFFVVNHTQPLSTSVPPIGPTIAEARRQGALLDLDKHNWPWSMMLLPVARIDLYELSNNHVWRAPFLFGDWYPEYVAPYMNVDVDDQGHFTEQGWLDFGFENYYTLLNCGFKLRPTAGTAVGVHPVPMGFGRVYVQVDGDFEYSEWIEGLKAGRSFVTTGPMLRVRFHDQLAGAEFERSGNTEIKVTGEIDSLNPIDRIEIIRNGQVVERWKPESENRDGAGYAVKFERTVSVPESGWLAIRCYEERADQRPRFAHSGPVFITVDDKPIRPRRVEVDYLIERMEVEIQRHRGVLSDEALQEFEQALDYYRQLQPLSR